MDFLQYILNCVYNNSEVGVIALRYLHVPLGPYIGLECCGLSFQTHRDRHKVIRLHIILFIMLSIIIDVHVDTVRQYIKLSTHRENVCCQHYAKMRA